MSSVPVATKETNEENTVLKKIKIAANLINKDDTVQFDVALLREKGQLLFPIQQQDPRPDNV